jgi:hypothetical protein
VSNRRGGQHTLRPPPESIEKGEAEQAGRNTRGDAGTAGLQRRCFTRHAACQRKADSARSIFHRSRSTSARLIIAQRNAALQQPGFGRSTSNDP